MPPRLTTAVLSALFLSALIPHTLVAQTVPLPQAKPEAPNSEKPDTQAPDTQAPAPVVPETAAPAQAMPSGEAAPVPDKKPPIDAPADAVTPVETEKSGEKQDTGKTAPEADRASESNDTPSAKPETGETKTEKAKTEETKPAEKPAPVLVVEPENEQEHAACVADLKAMGASFEPAARIDDGNGCGIDRPLTVTGILPGVALEPKGTMRCETALELARWTKEAVLPAADAALADYGPLTTINQASSYICRLRNNAATGKISEHARGNAIDIASFTFKTGKSIAIQPRDDDSTLSGAFQRAVTATGCLYFETVLDPGSDEAHENHLHFDVLQRRGGYRYCR